MRLPTRLALTAVAVLVATLAVVAVVTYQIVRVTGRQSLDRALHDELATVAASFPELLDGDSVTGDDLRRAAQQYLALHPGTSRHLTVLAFGDDVYTTNVGPDALLDLHEDDELPLGRPGRLTTENTEEGDIRVLNTPLLVGGQPAGRAIIAGPLHEVQDDAANALAGIAIAGSIGLLLGGVALTIITQRAVRPVVDLAAAARRIGAAELAARVPEPRHDDEVGQLATEFNRMLERIHDDAEHRRRLLSAVSHELRTPLAVAQGHLEMFEALDVSEDVDTEGGQEALVRLATVLRGELDRLARVADDLEAVLHGDAADAVEIGPVFVPDLFDELGERLAGLAIGSVELVTPPPVVVEADQDRLAQALLNLVDNAVTHTPPGTHVAVDTDTDEDHLHIHVIDDGPGIDPAIRDRIFEPFVTTRADGSTRGRGLGLAIVKSLVEAQHGTIDISTDGGGTHAVIRLPLAPGDD